MISRSIYLSTLYIFAKSHLFYRTCFFVKNNAVQYRSM